MWYAINTGPHQSSSQIPCCCSKSWRSCCSRSIGPDLRCSRCWGGPTQSVGCRSGCELSWSVQASPETNPSGKGRASSPEPMPPGAQLYCTGDEGRGPFSQGREHGSQILHVGRGGASLPTAQPAASRTRFSQDQGREGLAQHNPQISTGMVCMAPGGNMGHGCQHRRTPAAAGPGTQTRPLAAAQVWMSPWSWVAVHPCGL